MIFPNFTWFIWLFYVIKCIYLDIYPKLSPCCSAQYISFTVLRPKLFVQFNLEKQCQLLIRQLFPAHLREKVRTTFGKWYGFSDYWFLPFARRSIRCGNLSQQRAWPDGRGPPARRAGAAVSPSAAASCDFCEICGEKIFLVCRISSIAGKKMTEYSVM